MYDHMKRFECPQCHTQAGVRISAHILAAYIPANAASFGVAPFANDEGFGASDVSFDGTDDAWCEECSWDGLVSQLIAVPPKQEPRHLSRGSEVRYIENPATCPFCGERDECTTHHPMQFDEGNLQVPYRERKCLSCGQVWTDVYKLVAVFTDYDRSDR